MRRTMLTVLAVLAFMAQTQAQDANDQKGSFGILTGFTSMNVTGKVMIGNQQVNDAEAYNGFYLGVFKNFSFSEKLSLQPELQFARYYGQGVHDESFGDLVLPVLLHYHFSDSFNMFIGPRFDYLLPDDDEVENLNQFGFGMQLGGQWDLGSKFFVQISASLGFSERVENDNGPVFGNDYVDMRTQTFNVGFGYRL